MAEPKVNAIKPKPARDSLKIQINNNEAVLKKGDEIIFRHDGETYSSQVYAINGDEISFVDSIVSSIAVAFVQNLLNYRPVVESRSYQIGSQ